MTDTGWIELSLNTGVMEATDGRKKGFRYRVLNGNHVYVQAGFGFHYNYRQEFIINSESMPTKYMPQNKAFIYVMCDDNPSSSVALTAPSSYGDYTEDNPFTTLLGVTAGSKRDIAMVSCNPSNGQWTVVKTHNMAIHQTVTTAGYAWVDFQIDYFLD